MANSSSKKPRNAPHVYVCEYCGKEYIQKYGHKSKFCSHSCSNLARYGKPEDRKPKGAKAKQVTPKNCLYCDASFIPNVPYQKYCSQECCNNAQKLNKRKQWAEDYIPRHFCCPTCGKVITTQYRYVNSVYCCKVCADRKSREAEHKTTRFHEYSIEAKKRRAAQIREAFVENVSYDALYERDNGICQICGLPVIYDKHADNNWSGTIDHIVPLSRGGIHSMSNCQLAHRICNSLKGSSDCRRIDWRQKSTTNNYWKMKFDGALEIGIAEA